MFKVSNKQNLNHFNIEKTGETLIIDDDVPTQESLEDIDEVSSVASSDDTSIEENLKKTINEKDIDHLDDIKEATKIICGSARSMGIEVKEWKKDQKDTS